MRPLDRLQTSLFVAVAAALVSGGCAANRFPELPPTIQMRSVDEIWLPFAQKERIEPIPGVHPVYQMEAVVMKYGRKRKLF